MLGRLLHLCLVVSVMCYIMLELHELTHILSTTILNI